MHSRNKLEANYKKLPQSQDFVCKIKAPNGVQQMGKIWQKMKKLTQDDHARKLEIRVPRGKKEKHNARRKRMFVQSRATDLSRRF